MEGFKKLPKMQCFKEGGYVTSMPKSVVEKTTKVAPTGNKKAKAKSAAVAPKEKEDKVDITTMKKGGRAKKAVGTVKKFVKPSGDKDAIKKVKDTSKKAAAKVKGKEIKKFAVGGLTNGLTITQNPLNNIPMGGPAPVINDSYSDPSLDGSPRPYVKDEGFGNGPYPQGYQSPGNLTMAPESYPNNPLGMTPAQPRPYNPYGQPNYNPVINNSNTMNANVGGEGNTYNPGFGGVNPMQNPGGQPPFISQQPAGQAPAPSAPAGSVNLLPGLFGANQ